VLAGGVGVAVPVPRLIGMLNDSGTAYAAGGALPIRFGTWFFGNGIIPNRWIPASTGSGSAWQLSEQLSPLQEIKPWLAVLSGCRIMVPNSAPHTSMPAAALSGAQVGTNSTQLPTIDQLVAQITGAGTTYPNGLHVGISNVSGATSLGTSISYSGPSAPNPPEFSPAALFKKLVQFVVSTGSSTSAPDPELLNRSLVVDAVLADARALRARLGTDDRARLDMHLEGLNQLQNQIARAEMPTQTNAMLPDPDKVYPNRGTDGSISRQRGQAFSDLLVFAMATDLTRIFSYMFSCPASHGTYVDCGLDPSTFHEDYGHRLSPKGVAYATAGFNTGVKYAMSNLADTLVRMKNTPDGAGNLLDNSCVYVTSCVAESQTHGGVDYPILVAGKAGGRIKSDQHVRRVDENVSKVPFTLLTALGGTQTSFGKAEGQVTGGISELLV
jgi:hypothetical protein